MALVAGDGTLLPPSDRTRRDPYKELPAQGIARTRVVLSGRQACCQSESG
jgi:hypothetical protein